MLPRTSKFPAQPAERPVLASPWITALLAGLVGGALWLMYPRQDLERRLSESSEKDASLSLSYLRNLLRSDPNNPQLQALMQEHLAREAKKQEAQQAAETFRKAAGPEHQQIWMRWNESWERYNALRSDDTVHRAALHKDLVAQLHTLVAARLPLRILPTLADQALALGEPGLAAPLHARLAEEAPSRDQASRYYAQAARDFLATAHHRDAALLLMKARHAAPEPAQAKAYFLQALATLRASGNTAQAWAMAEAELGDLHNDPDVLYLMVELARAAGKPAQAEQYMKQLLKLALQLQWTQMRLAEIPAIAFLAPARWNDFAQEDNAPTPLLRPAAWRPGMDQVSVLRTANEDKGGPGLAFDDKVYSLGFQVFLENRNVEDAWRVARAAVQQAPQDLAWRERLAQTSEWTQRQALALEHWWYIARTAQKDAAWQAVLRLAPGLFQDEPLIEGLRYELRRQPDNARLAQELIMAYERQGSPRPAIEFLRQQPPTPATLELLADLAERSGDMEQALATWTTLLQDASQASLERAMRAATLAVTQNRPELAMRWLEAAQGAVGTDTSEAAADYWRMTGQLAERQQRPAMALRAFRELIANPKADVADYDTLIRMLQHEEPLQTAQVATLAWERFDLPRHLVLAMNLYAGRNQWPAMQQLMARLDQRPHAQRRAAAPLMQDPEFVRLGALYFQNSGRPALAGQWLDTGLRLAPDDANMRQAIIWLLVDCNDNVALRKLLSQNESAWSQDSDMHDTLGVAYQALSLPAVALQRYFTPRLAQHQQDFLWLMNYADALDQNQESDKSWRLRRHLLTLEGQPVQTAARLQAGDDLRAAREQARRQWLTEDGLNTTRRVARARLIIMNRPGDPALDTLRELLRLDRDSTQALSNAAAETAIGWLQDAQQYTAERGFLWQQYARSLGTRSNRPLWADITLALAEKDLAATGELLETFGDRLPRYDRVNAAAAVHDTRQAQSIAFDTQTDQPDDAPLHLQLTENLLAFSDHAGAGLASRQLGALEEKEATADFHVALTPRLSLDLGLSRTERVAGIPRLLQNPSNEQGIKLALRWRTQDSTTQLRLERRISMATYTPVQVEHEWRIDERLTLKMDVGLQLPTQESTVLRMGGMADRTGLALRYLVTRRDQFSAEHWQDRFRLQTGARVGSGDHTALTYTHAYRLDVPTLEFSAFWSQHDYRRNDPASLSGRDLLYQQYLPPGVTDVDSGYFLPDNFRFYGLQVSTNTRFQRDYTRAVLPYASIARTWHSRQGAGYNLQLGLSGSVLGGDHLNLGWNLVRGGTQTQGLSRELQLRYRLHF